MSWLPCLLVVSLAWSSMLPSTSEWGLRFGFVFKKKIFKKKKKTKSKSLRRGLEIGCLLIVYRGEVVVER